MALDRLLDRDTLTLGHIDADFVAKARTVDHSGRHAVDVDVVGAGLEREALGNSTQTPFGCGIGHAACTASHAERAADIDDLAVALRHHGGKRGAHGVEAT